jgi:hypothetical protein
MATIQQYEVFKFIFEEQKTREGHLLERSKLYLSLVTFYSAFLLFVGKDLVPRTLLHWFVFALSTVFLLVAFLLSLHSAVVKKYEAIQNPKNIIKTYGDAPPADEDFLDDRIVDLAVAWERNSSVNDSKAKVLYWAGLALLSGMAAHAAYFLARLWPTGGAS